MKKTLAILVGSFLLLGSVSSLIAYETSHRAFVNGPGVHLSAVRITSLGGAQNWIVSGFAPGVGSFNQNVNAADIKFSYKDGLARVTTAVTSLTLGILVPLDVTWNTPASPVTQTVNIPNPSRVLTIDLKRTNVSGLIGTFNLGSVTGVSGGVDQRVVNP